MTSETQAAYRADLVRMDYKDLLIEIIMLLNEIKDALDRSPSRCRYENPSSI